MSLKHIKLFENFVNTVNEGKDDLYKIPAGFPGTKTYDVSNDKFAHKGIEFDNNRYPKYINENADRLKAWLKDSKENNKGWVIKSGDKYILVNRYDNGLYYSIKEVPSENLDKYTPINKKIVDKVIEKPVEEPIKKIVEKPIEKTIEKPVVKKARLEPLTIWRDGNVQRTKGVKDASGKTVKSTTKVGNLGRKVKIGYKKDGNLLFNDSEGNAWLFSPDVNKGQKISKEESGLKKYKLPTKREFRKFLKTHNINL